MIKKIIGYMLTAALICGAVIPALACTGIAVGRDATADGSAIFGRNEDISSAYNKNFKVNPATTGEGTVMFEDPYNGFAMPLPAAGAKWTMVNDVPEHNDGLFAECVTNDYGVALSATVTTYYNDAAGQADPLVYNGIREAYLPNIVIPFAKTAREAVLLLGAAVEQYGSAECNTVLIGDADDIWIVEIVSGHNWAAARVPDDKYAVMPNCMMLGFVDLADPDNFLGSADLFALPEKAGFLKTHNGKPHVTLTWGAGLEWHNRTRAWGGRHFFSPSQQVPIDADVFDMFMTPDEKISLTDAMKLLSYRFEHTAFNANVNPDYAPIGHQNTAESHLFQFRQGLPPLQWLAMGNPEHTVFLPSYFAITKTPAAFQIEGLDVHPDSAYWTFRTLSALAEEDRARFSADVKARWQVFQQRLIDSLPGQDAQFMALDGADAAQFANEWFKSVSEDALREARVMTEEIRGKMGGDK